MLCQLIRDDLHNVTVNGCHMAWWTFSLPVVIGRHSNPIHSIWFRACLWLWEGEGTEEEGTDLFSLYQTHNGAKEKKKKPSIRDGHGTHFHPLDKCKYPPPQLISVLLLDYMAYFESRMINYALWNCTNYLTEQLPAWLYAPLQN